jgi:acyl carrier protein
MTEDEIRRIIFRGLTQIAPETDPEELSPDENIREALDIDSYDFLMFLIGLNETLGIEIPEADYELLATLNNLVRYLTTRLDGG